MTGTENLTIKKCLLKLDKPHFIQTHLILKNHSIMTSVQQDSKMTLNHIIKINFINKNLHHPLLNSLLNPFLIISKEKNFFKTPSNPKATSLLLMNIKLLKIKISFGLLKNNFKK
jgi:hypothetical protein